MRHRNPLLSLHRHAPAEFASIRGRRWRSDLTKLWEAGTEGTALRGVRNAIGPGGLRRIKLPAGGGKVAPGRLL